MISHAIAVKAVLVKGDEVLLVKRSSKDPHKPGVWEIPGGRLDAGEDPHKGLLREVKEEVGLEAEIIAPIQIRHFTRDDGQVITMIIFLAKAKTVAVKLSSEHSDFTWEKISLCKNKLVPHFHEVIDKIVQFKFLS
jgi:8-oxo-dGTP diphosphatase